MTDPISFPRWHRAVVATPEQPLVLLGGALTHAEIRFATWGEPDADRSNAILVCHSFSADAFAAGSVSGLPAGTFPWLEGRAGWWDGLIGPGKAIDTDRYWVVCSAVIGGSGGSTGPQSPRGESEVPWGIEFPYLSVRDIVEAQDRLRESLGIARWKMVVGGSLGGLQTLTWALAHPDRMDRSVVVAAASRPSLSGIGHFAAGCAYIRREIESGGDGYQGLLSSFGTGRRYSGPPGAAVSDPAWRGEWPRERFHPWSYVRLAEALMTFDLAFDWGEGELKRACALARAPLDLVSFRDDLLFVPDDIAQLADAFRKNGIEATCHHLAGTAGHDSFLTEPEILAPLLARRLA